MTNTLYGLKNCDSCRKAMKWLSAQDIEVALHDVRDDGLSEAMLDTWLAEFGVEALVNRRSTTWRQLDASERDALDAVRARSLLLKHPTLVKRPVLHINGQWVLGFTEARYATLLAGAD